MSDFDPFEPFVESKGGYRKPTDPICYPFEINTMKELEHIKAIMQFFHTQPLAKSPNASHLKLIDLSVRNLPTRQNSMSETLID